MLRVSSDVDIVVCSRIVSRWHDSKATRMIHFCPLDKECRSYDCPPRLHIGTKKWFIIVAPRSRAKVQKSGTHWTENKSVWVDWTRKK